MMSRRGLRSPRAGRQPGWSMRLRMEPSRVITSFVLLLAGGCGAGIADIRPHIDRCDVVRVEYVREGTFVVTHATTGHGAASAEERIRYAGAIADLEEALETAPPRCGAIPRLRE
jgi:hypothetical protein